MSSYPTFVLSTSVGRLCAMAIDRNTIRVTTTSYGPDIEGADSEAVVNGVVYQASIHVYGPDAWAHHDDIIGPEDGPRPMFLTARMKPGEQPDWTSRRSDLVIDGWATTFAHGVRLTRADRKDPSDAAKNKAEASVVSAVAEWWVRDRYSMAIILAAADVVSLEAEHSNADEDVLTATKALRAAQDVYDEVAVRLREGRHHEVACHAAANRTAVAAR